MFDHKKTLIDLFIKLGNGSRKKGRKVFNDYFGVSHGTSGNWMGKRGIPSGVIAEINERFDIPIEYLVVDNEHLEFLKCPF